MDLTRGAESGIGNRTSNTQTTSTQASADKPSFESNQGICNKAHQEVIEKQNRPDPQSMEGKRTGRNNTGRGQATKAAGRKEGKGEEEIARRREDQEGSANRQQTIREEFKTLY